MNKVFLILLFVSVLSFGQRPESLELIKLHESGKYEEAINKALEYLKVEPKYITFHLVLGQVYTDIFEYKKAITHLEFTVENDSLNSFKKAIALEYLGICNFMLSDYEKSEDNLDKCIKLNARKTITDEAIRKKELFGYNKFYEDWKIIETNNFRFHFQKMKDSEIQLYMKSREEAFKLINTFFNSSIPKKIDFFVWNSKTAAKEVLKTNLGFSKPNFCIVHTYYQQTIGHEMTHVISNYTSDISNKTRFINEGTAVCFDQSNNDRLKQIKDWIASNNKQIVIKDYWANGEKYAEEILYPLSGLFVKELIDNFGKEKFLEFFKNQTYENAKLVFGDKLDNVIQELENKINE